MLAHTTRSTLRFILTRLFVVTISILATILITVTYSVVSRQRSLIFVPRPPSLATPADYGVPYQALMLDNNQGGKIAAWWLTQNIDPYSKPTVLYCHGNAATLSDLAHVAQIFYMSGWNALLFDYRGYGRSSPAIPELSEDSVAQDATTAFNWLSERIERKKIFIWGHSLGSAIASSLAARTQPSGLILEGGFPSIIEAARARYRFLPLFEWMAFDKFSTSKYLMKYKGPVIIAHADGDTVVPFYLGEKIYNSANNPKEFIRLKGINHQDFPSVHSEYMPHIKEVVDSWTKDNNY